MPLSDSATSSHGNLSAPIIERVLSPPVKGEINNPSSQVRRGPKKVKYQAMGSISENAVKQTKSDRSDKESVNKELIMPPTEVVWIWNLSGNSWLRIDLDKQEKEN